MGTRGVDVSLRGMAGVDSGLQVRRVLMYASRLDQVDVSGENGRETLLGGFPPSYRDC
jgi:hypothetical protein